VEADVNGVDAGLDPRGFSSVMKPFEGPGPKASLYPQDLSSLFLLITSALVEKPSSLRAEEYLAQRAARGSRAKFDAVLAKVRDAGPMKGDEPVAKVHPKAEG